MTAATPFLHVKLKKRLAAGKEEKSRLNERFGLSDKEREDKRLVWFHAASVGESIAILPLINRFLRDYKDIQIMVTTGTVTSAEMMKKRLPEGAFHQYTPMDNPVWVNNFLDHWQPDFVIWTESELWPSMLSEIKSRNIPAILLNVRMSYKSFKRWSYAKATAVKILSAFKECIGPRTEVEKLQKLGYENVKVIDNLKYCTPAQAYEEKSLLDLTNATVGKKILLWSATHKGEEEIAVSIHKKLSAEIDNLLTIILPRHPNRKDEIVDMLKQQGMNYSCRSEGKLPTAENNIYVADTMGETGLFYKLCGICVMGGTFVDVGGHNIIEPAHYACKIFYGPQIFNFATIHEDFTARGASVQVQTEDEMAKELLTALKNPEHFAKMGEEAHKLAKEKESIIDNIMKEISPYMESIV